MGYSSLSSIVLAGQFGRDDGFLVLKHHKSDIELWMPDQLMERMEMIKNILKSRMGKAIMFASPAIPKTMSYLALLPVAHFKGEDSKSAMRLPASMFIHREGW